DAVREAIRPRSAHAPRSRLLVTEQTSNLGGGAIWPRDQLSAVADVAREAGLATHLDGARILNASVATGIPPQDYARGYDSAWIAFTKGLGCPVGAVLAGSKAFIEEAWLFKRRWGGAMRQTGVLAAMCLYALDHHVERLSEDHAVAALIGDGLRDNRLFGAVDPVDTNIVLAALADGVPDAPEIGKRLREKGFRATVVGRRRLRMVTHMHVDAEDARALLLALEAIAAEV
ncbi:MAG: beta-eliminating lyase-related protein, partial [Pseudomonadota bacterium]